MYKAQNVEGYLRIYVHVHVVIVFVSQIVPLAVIIISVNNFIRNYSDLFAVPSYMYMYNAESCVKSSIYVHVRTW